MAMDSALDAHPWNAETKTIDSDRMIASMARFLIEGDEREEARLLLACTVEGGEDWWPDEFNLSGEPDHILTLRFHGPRRVYDLLRDDASNAHRSFKNAAEALLPNEFHAVSISARASIVAPHSPDWRRELVAVLDGKDVDNQAIGFKATKTYEGLRFRSESEVRIAQALDRAGVMYLPNCKARVGSKDRRRNLEADFLVCHEGKWGGLEVDGAEWHPAARAAQDHERDRPFLRHGAAVVQRFPADECFENPDGVASQFLALLKSR